MWQTLFRRHVMVFMLLAVTAVLLSTRMKPLSPHRDKTLHQSPLQPKHMAQAQLAKMPLYFIENQGQMDEQVAYYVQGADTTIYFTAEGITYVLTGGDEITAEADKTVQQRRFSDTTQEAGPSRERWVVKLTFVGANPQIRPVGQEAGSAVVSYFHGPQTEWHTALATYTSLIYHDLWPGIDLLYTGTGSQLKYTFLVKPGADPNQIRLAYGGAVVTLNEQGQLEVSTPVDSFIEDKPYTYQEVNGDIVEIQTAYSLQKASTTHTQIISFDIGIYDTSQPLLIDPVIFIYAGYIGGLDGDYGYGIAVDGAGNAYVTGDATSTEASFPEVGGPDLTHNGGFYDAFVAKVSNNGTSLVYAGYIGGLDGDYGQGIAVDGAGNAYVIGRTASTEASFPEVGGPDLTYNGGTDAFVAKISSSGTSLVYAGYIGGSDYDYGYGIAVDEAGNAYVAGTANSTEASFPEVGGPDLTYNGGGDAFVAKVSSSGTSLVYAGYIGGSGYDNGLGGIAVDGAGNAYVAGYTASTEASFPEVGGPDLTHNGGDFDAFVAKVSSGTSLVYAGYIGGSDSDYGQGIAVDEAGNAYVAGYTTSTEASFPVLVGPDPTANGAGDAFVAKISSGSELFLPLVLNSAALCFQGPEQEENNSAVQANGPLCFNTNSTGTLADNTDYFYLNLPANGTFSIDLTGNTGTDSQLQLYYQVVDGTHLVEYDATPPYHIDCSSSDCGTAGLYYILIYTPQPDISGVPYTLRVTSP